MTQKSLMNLPVNPGIYTEQTERGAKGFWRDGDKVRFRQGLAEKIGGWVRLSPQFAGLARRMRDWTSLDGKNWTAIGTEAKLYLWQDGSPPTLFDITPIRRTATILGPFTTTGGSAIVTVADPNHGAQAGDYVRFANAIAGDGITIDGEYTVASVVDQNSYTIVHSATASMGQSGLGGTVDIEYDISVGASSATTATGYGTGPYGAEGYGAARTASTAIQSIRTWTLDNWGEDLLACPRGGAIYWWDRSKGTSTRAVALAGDAPPINEGVIISQRDRHVIALGAYDFFNDQIDPLLIRWSSTEDLNDWVPTSTNTAGDLRLYSGSKIVTGVRSRLELIVFTDVSVHTLPFIGGLDVFGLNIVGENVSILGPNCAVPVDSRVFFMAEADFYVYDGIVRVVPCTVRNLVYDNLNLDQKDKIYGGLNREFNEIWWFYPSYDPETWLQQTFELGLPPGYSLANATDAPASLYPNVVYQNNMETVVGQTSFPEQSQYAELPTYFGGSAIEAAGNLFELTAMGLDGIDGRVSWPIQTGNVSAWDGTGAYMTAEVGFRLDTLPGNGNVYGGMIVGDADFQLFRFSVERSSVGANPIYIRAGFANSGGIINVPGDTLSTGTAYFLIVEADYTGGPGNGVERVWLGEVGSTTVTLINTATGLTAKNPTGVTQVVQMGWDANSGTYFDGAIDNVRITAGHSTPRYGTGSVQTIPLSYETSGSPGGATDIGYVYSFNAGGYTSVASTADNSYEHDFFLTNNDPIITPLQGEYAVELDVDPDIGGGTGLAGISFLRSDISGTPETDADDANQWMVELDYANDRVIVVKKTSAGINNPDNLVSNTADFTTLTGSAMTTGQRYIITVQVDTPQITVYVDGNQAFQFDMSAAELLVFTGGTFGLHMRAAVSNDDQYRFYNLATGPIGTITAADFDISPIEVNRYVAFNYEEGHWTVGKMARTAWADRSPQLEKAYAAAPDGYLYQHETGTDDNGAAMPAFVESYDMEIPEAGEELMHVDQIIPDFLELEGQVDLYLTGRKYPQDPNRISKGPYPIVPGTRKVSTRIRARQIALRVESNTTGDKWRFGTWRGRAGAHGRRG